MSGRGPLQAEDGSTTDKANKKTIERKTPPASLSFKLNLRPGGPNAFRLLKAARVQDQSWRKALETSGKDRSKQRERWQQKTTERGRMPEDLFDTGLCFPVKSWLFR